MKARKGLNLGNNVQVEDGVVLGNSISLGDNVMNRKDSL